MVDGSVRFRQQVDAEHPGLGIYNASSRRDWDVDRMCVVVLMQHKKGDIRRTQCLVWSEDLDKFRNMTEDRSRKMAKEWKKLLMNVIERGLVKEAMRVFGCV